LTAFETGNEGELQHGQAQDDPSSPPSHSYEAACEADDSSLQGTSPSNEKVDTNTDSIPYVLTVCQMIRVNCNTYMQACFHDFFGSKMTKYTRRTSNFDTDLCICRMLLGVLASI
jgi:hypothetical protein